MDEPEPLESPTRTPSSPQGIVILAGPDESTNIVYHALAARLPVDRVIMEERVSRAQLLRRRAKKMGWAAVAGQALFQILIASPQRRRSAARSAEILRAHSLDTSPIPESKLSRVSSVNSDEAVALLRDLNPGAVVLNGTRIVSTRVLESVPAKFLNMHAGITPLYRGVHGAYWALVEGRKDACGVTVHFVDAGIDTGQIAAQALIEPGPADNFSTYPLLQVAAGVPLLVRAVEAVLQGTPLPPPVPPAGPSKLWSHPTLWGWLRARLTRGVR